MKTTDDTKWRFVPNLAIGFLLAAVTMGAISLAHVEHLAPTVTSGYTENENTALDHSTAQRDEGRKRPPREGRHHHGPPPPPPGIPPTVLFLIGGALGFLIGRSGRPGRPCPPPPPPRYHHEPPATVPA